MVISSNIEPHKSEFENLLIKMVDTLKADSVLSANRYRKLSSTDLEVVTKEVMQECAINTPFENTIELISGQRLPDIIAYNYYGVEVKTTKSNHWKSIGSSVAESTRVNGIERIFMLFGKLADPIDFICKPYEQCLSDVVVTHSPRYSIDMKLNEGETFFDKIKIEYDVLRKQDNPIKIILDYYRSLLKPGETTWWAETGESKKSKMVLRLWNTLSFTEKRQIKNRAICLFPEIMGDSQIKFNRMNLWLASVESIIVPNVRYLYTAGGKKTLLFQEKSYTVPKIVFSLCNELPLIMDTLQDIDIEELIECWGMEVDHNVAFQIWTDMICEYSRRISNFPLKEYITQNK